MKKIELTSLLSENKLGENKSKGHDFDFRHIFIDRTEYERLGIPTEQPQWVLLMQGHGFYNFFIAGMPLRDFKDKILPFFTQSIVTKLLTYKSRYANGHNADTIYSGTIAEQEQYSFPIITTGIYDTSPTNEMEITIKNDTPSIYFKGSSENFFDHAMDMDNETNLTDALSLLDSSLFDRYAYPFNTFFIRYPNTRTFVPYLRSLTLGLEDQKNNHSLDLQQALQEHKAEKPHYVFLTTPECKRTIIINNDDFFIASMVLWANNRYSQLCQLTSILQQKEEAWIMHNIPHK